MAVVVPNTQASADSSQIAHALLPVEPRSMIIPASFVLAEIPLFNSNMLSAITVLVVETVVVVPLTVKLPAIVMAELIVTAPVPFGVSVIFPSVAVPVQVEAAFVN